MTTKKENAIVRIRIFPSTLRRLRMRAVREGKTTGELVEELEKKAAKYDILVKGETTK